MAVGWPQEKISPAPAQDTRHTRIHRGSGGVRLALCGTSGWLLSAAFPPWEWNGLAWIAVVPALLAAVPGPTRRPVLQGIAFGLTHCLFLFSWLNEVGFGAGFLLGTVIAAFPAGWYVLAAEFATGRGDPDGRESGLLRKTADESARVLLPAALWVALEWLRSWAFTGLPWGFAGVSQWNNAHILPLTTLTGIYGISFLVVAVNCGVVRVLLSLWQRDARTVRRRAAWLGGLLLVAWTVPWGANRLFPAPPPSDHGIRVGVVQGNIPQARGRAAEVLPMALNVYDRLSRQLVRQHAPDLLLWPETAVPAALRFNEDFASVVARLSGDTRTPLLLGTPDYRFVPAEETPSKTEETETIGVNSAFLIGEDGTILERYDKTHLVPFGEYTPFEKHLPFLADWIGMGKSLTSGNEYTLFRLAEDVLMGVNICYEDCFPHISRAFVQRGANVLATITNDAWYAESAGSRQHMIHAVFRAVENRRPLLRSGNNSDTCLIRADGRVEELLYDTGTGNRFFRGARVYDVRRPRMLPITFYTRYGDVFAGLCVTACILAACRHAVRFARRKYRLYTAVRGVPPRP